MTAPVKLMYLTVGENKGAPRLFVESARLRAAGLDVGEHYEPTYDSTAKRIRLTVAQDGSRMVCRRRRADGEIPLIDLNSQKLSMFGIGSRVVVFIRPDCVEIELDHNAQREIERIERLTDEINAGAISTGELCAGGGVMAEALHSGLERAGVRSSLAFAVEVEPSYVSVLDSRCQAVAPSTLLVQGGIQQVDTSKLPAVSLLAAGLPCTGASLSGRAKNKLRAAEEHTEAGHLFVHFLRIIEAVNPAVVILENVPQYATSMSYAVITACLREWGYDVEHRILDRSLGGFENRERMVMVAQTRGLGLTFDDLRPAGVVPATLGELLDDIPADDARFKRYDYLKEKEIRDAAAGKGFRQQIVGPDATSCGVIGRGYAKVRSTEIRLRCPTDPEKSRLLTPAEHARVKGIREAHIAGLPDTTAHEVLGQSVLFGMLCAVGTMIGAGLRRYAGAAVGACEAVAAAVAPAVVPVLENTPCAPGAGQLDLFGRVA